MCGRFVLYASKERIKQQYSAQIPFDFESRYNIAPGQNIISLSQDTANNRIVAKTMLWGLHPLWGDIKSKLIINARCETVHEKPTFKNLFRSNRCVVIANGWYEWLRENNQKRPYYFSRRDRRLIAFAGIMSTETESAPLEGLILTRSSPNNLKAIHDRTPFLLTREQVSHWLSDETFSYVSQQAIDTFDASIIGFREVSTQVNTIRNDNQYLIDKVIQN